MTSMFTGPANDLGEFLAELLDLGALLANDNARASGGDDDLHLVASALDLDLGNSSLGEDTCPRNLRISMSLARFFA